MTCQQLNLRSRSGCSLFFLCMSETFFNNEEGLSPKRLVKATQIWNFQEP